MKLNPTRWLRAATPALLMSALVSSLQADEGMWLFNNPPRKLLKEKYGFDATDAWLEHVQKSSVRFNSGGSVSFVSEDGLAISNHHVGADALQKFGDKDHDYLRDGFYAHTLAEEKRCLDLELNVLMSIEDVTDRVNAAVKPGVAAEEAFTARRAVISAIEKGSLDKTGLRSDVVTLYQGGQYHLYRFKKYTDVRLVFAPEQQIAFYGGDPDNFEYPRFDLDICLFRVYENGKPAKIEHYLKWSEAGAAENEVVFVSGHPGRTSRLFTVAELEYIRDQRLPYALERLRGLEVLLLSYSARSDENARRAKEDLFGVQNSRKAYTGEIAGILDPALMEQKLAAEKKLRAAVAADPALKEASGAWDSIAEARLGSLEFQLFSEKPIYDDLEQLTLADSLTFLAGKLGYADPLLQKILAGKSPADRARELVRGTKIRDVPSRKTLYNGGRAAVDAARDPMIELARLIDPEARALRKIIETQSESKQQAHARISKARFAIEGTGSYPDATFTLRLAFGTVKGYEENGAPVPFQTTIDGLYQRGEEHKNQPPFDIPPRWLQRKGRLNLKTPFNFVCTADIIGGNSGSPVVNRKGEFVGIIFDGNIQSLVLDFAFTEKQ